MSEYEDLTNDEFAVLLLEVLEDVPKSQIVFRDGIYEILAEEYNNDVLELWKERQQDKVNDD